MGPLYFLLFRLTLFRICWIVNCLPPTFRQPLRGRSLPLLGIKCPAPTSFVWITLVIYDKLVFGLSPASFFPAQGSARNPDPSWLNVGEASRSQEILSHQKCDEFFAQFNEKTALPFNCGFRGLCSSSSYPGLKRAMPPPRVDPLTPRPCPHPAPCGSPRKRCFPVLRSIVDSCYL